MMRTLEVLSIAYMVSEWVLRVAMIGFAMRRRNPNSAMAWLLVVFFMPWPGFIFYLLIGDKRLPQRRIERHARLLQRISEVFRRFHGHPAFVDTPPPGVDPVAVQLAQRLGYLPILDGNRADLISSSDEVIDRIVADIDAAKNHVHMLFYIWGDDGTGRRVADALRRAVARGANCRVLVDAVGSHGMLQSLAPKMRAAGIEVLPALPVNVFRRRAARFDLRNHRKLAIIDGAIGYTGSQNIIDPGYGRDDLAWHDLTVRLTGPVVTELQAVFLADWYFETNLLLSGDDLFPEPNRTGDIPVQTLPSGPSFPSESFQRIVVSALYGARERVTITTPYFIPDEPFLQALEVAVLRGVRVRLIVPCRFDQRLVGAATRSYYEDLFNAGVEVYRFESGLLHSKTMAIDGATAIIGTSNFDIRSFALNYEVTLLIYAPATVQALEKIQDGYLRQSTRLDPITWSVRPWPKRAAQYVARLLSPLL